MKRRFLITAANTGCGKTHTTLALLESLAKTGLRVGALKPIETGVEQIPEDGAKLLEACRRLNPGFKDMTIDDVVPVQMELPAAPFVAQTSPIDWRGVTEALERIEAVSDVVLIESAGGVMTPIEENFFVADMAGFFRAPVIFLATDSLGMISETLVNHALLRHRSIPFYWAVNRFGEMKAFDTINRPFLDTAFNKLFILPDDLEKFTALLLSGNPQ